VAEGRTILGGKDHTMGQHHPDTSPSGGSICPSAEAAPGFLHFAAFGLPDLWELGDFTA